MVKPVAFSLPPTNIISSPEVSYLNSVISFKLSDNVELPVKVNAEIV